MVHDMLPAAARRPRPMPAWKIGFYRQCRLWHGYLSAFAFIALMFFSVTGILLNHPDWIRQADSQPVETRFILPHGDIAAALKTSDPAQALSALAQRQGDLRGIYASGDVDGDEALLRFEGVSGNTGVTLQIKSGAADATFRKADTLSVINDLHRGKNAGKAWKLLIDVSAAIFMA
ncbi:MAG TPA: PepSY-associated TM helix domain-containing protein, partial [Rhizomicrobium sp.]|nr:PepSY-associated TM helix domain-containing protein [Rhizomicrobium sp.]